MRATIRRVLLLSLICWSPLSSNEIATKLVELPAYPPHVLVVDQTGKPLNKLPAHELEFSSLMLNIPVKAEGEPQFRPTDLRLAACELRRMLPTEFYHRLLKGHSDIAVYGIIRADPAVTERIADLSFFIDDTWGHEWSDEEDPIRRLVILLDFLDRNEDVMNCKNGDDGR